MNDTPTPRTDMIIQDGMIFDKDGSMLAALARELERDLAAAQERVRELENTQCRFGIVQEELFQRAERAESALFALREENAELKGHAEAMEERLADCVQIEQEGEYQNYRDQWSAETDAIIQAYLS